MMTRQGLAMGIVIVSVIAWVSYLGWSASRMTTTGSPDEAANRLISKQLATTGSYRMPTALTSAQLQVYRPRSLSVSGSDLGPGSFLGFVQYHAIAQRVFGTHGSIILTLVIFGVALLALYRIGRRYWEPVWAMMAVLLAATMPAVAIFNTLPYHHAALFTSSIIISGWALLRFQEVQTWRRAIVFGLFYGVALSIRPVEVLFTGPIVAVVMLVHRHGWRYLLGAVGATMLVQVPWLIAGTVVFGAPLASGYTTSGVNLVMSDAPGSGVAWYRLFLPPGGVFSWHTWSAVWDSFVRLTPLHASLVTVAIIYYLRRKLTSWSKFAKLGVVILMLGYYLAFYGSLDLAPITIENVGFQISYLRYWLPFTVAMAAGIIVTLRAAFRWPIRWGVTACLVLICLNVSTVIWHNSGLLAARDQDLRQVRIQSDVLGATQPSSLVIAYNYDKLFVGQRMTSYRGPKDIGDWIVLRSVASDRAVYLLTTPVSIRPESMTAAAADVGLTTTKVLSVSDATLWRLVPGGVEL